MTRTLQPALWTILLASGLAAAITVREAGAAQNKLGAPVAPGNLPDVLMDLPQVEQKDVPPGKKLALPTEVPTTAMPAPTAFNPADVVIAAPNDPQFFFSADYLLWWIRRGPTPPLVTTGPTTGVIGDPGTQVLFGQNGLDYGTKSGIRLTAGWNFGPDEFWGVELSGVLLQPGNINFAVASNAAGSPLLVRPFISTEATSENTATSVPNFQGGVTISSPGSLEGGISIESHSQFWGYDANLVAHSVRDGDRRFDLLMGFRTLALDESLNINENFTLLQPGASIFQTQPVGMVSSIMSPPAGSTISVFDGFDTHNHFYGGQLGGRFEWIFNHLTLSLTGKLALGVTQQSASLFGVSKLDQKGQPEIVTEGGVLALSMNGTNELNIGNYDRTRFGVVPELGLNVQYDVTSHIRAHLGYTGLYWSSVARPGGQIDDVINPKLIPTGVSLGSGTSQNFNPAVDQYRPSFQFNDNGFWAQGLDFGIEFRF